MERQCSTPAKRRYPTQQAAELASTRQVLWAGGQFLRAYRCPCDWWHLTSRHATGLPAQYAADSASRREVA